MGDRFGGFGPQNLPERLLQAAIGKMVSEKLGTLLSELGAFAKSMSTADAKATKFMVLEMVRNSCAEFYTKMVARIEKPEQQPE